MAANWNSRWPFPSLGSVFHISRKAWVKRLPTEGFTIHRKQTVLALRILNI